MSMRPDDPVPAMGLTMVVTVRVRFRLDLSWNDLLKLRLFGGREGQRAIQTAIREALEPRAASVQTTTADTQRIVGLTDRDMNDVLSGR